MDDALQIDSLVDLINRELNINTPEDYIYFLEKYSKNEKYLSDIYFIDSSMFDYDKIPCVIGATKKFRDLNIIPKQNSMAIMNKDDIIYYLDTNDNSIHEIIDFSIDRNMNISFAEWVNNIIGEL